MKRLSIVLGICLCLFPTVGYCSDVDEMIRRYDYSSPAASLNSLKKAIIDRDMEGVAIHVWQFYKSAQGTSLYGMSFAEALADLQARSAGPGPDFFEVSNLIFENHLQVTEVKFAEEIMCDHSDEATGMTVCLIWLERESDGKRAMASALKYDGTEEWWINIEHVGE